MSKTPSFLWLRTADKDEQVIVAVSQIETVEVMQVGPIIIGEARPEIVVVRLVSGRVIQVSDSPEEITEDLRGITEWS